MVRAERMRPKKSWEKAPIPILVVEVVSDSKGNRPMTPKTIDLSETPFLYITGPVSESTK